MSGPNATQCPPASLLADFGLGKLDDAGAESVSRHLETCADCQSRVAGVSGDTFVGRLRQVGQVPAEAPAVEDGRSRPSRKAVGKSRDGLGSPPSPKDVQGRPPHERDGLVPERRDSVSAPPELANHPDYELIKELGRGGMGTVYLAKNRMMDRLEVLKVISQTLLNRPGSLERFQQEIRSAAKLQHTNIVAAYSVARAGDLLVFAMEYVPGQDLALLVRRYGYQPATNAAFYAHQVAIGLQHAHEKGMVHRDIKPNNLMLAIEGKKHTIKILDFGLAKATSEKGSESGLTKTGQMLGTPDYVAPEQALDAQKADIRADIYSLGCTLYFLLSGGPPFEEASVYETLEAHQTREPQPLNLLRPEVPAELAVVVAKMMAKDPAKRYQTPIEVAKALAPFFKPSAGTVAASVAETLPSFLPAAVAQPAATAGPGTVLIKTESRRSWRGGWLSIPTWQRLLAAGFLTASVALGVMVTLRARHGEELTRALAADGAAEAKRAATPPVEPLTAVAPFDARQARSHQEAWAKHLGVPAVQTNFIGMKLVLIPPGKFTMGSTAEQNAAAEKLLDAADAAVRDSFVGQMRAELPAHRVTISRPFFLAATETSIAQFRRFVEAAHYETETERLGGGETTNRTETDPAKMKFTWRSPGRPVAEASAVCQLTWMDAVAFCNWLSAAEKLTPCYRRDEYGEWVSSPRGTGYRLPTEAEWEFACRAGTTTQYWFGDDAEQFDRYGGSDKSRPDPVAMKPPNPFGLFDMHGSVEEWCQDWFQAGYYASSPATDPAGPAVAGSRVLRGGADWSMRLIKCRSAFRRHYPPHYRFSEVGFRVARVVPRRPSGLPQGER